MGPMSGLPTLRDWLATLDETEIDELRSAHPGLEPHRGTLDLDSLAARLAHPATMLTALNTSPRPLLQVVETTAALGHSATAQRLCELLDDGDGDVERHVRDVSGWLDHACARGLLWRDGARLRVNPGIHDVVVVPLGLGRPMEQVLAEETVDTIRTMAGALGLPTAGRKAELIARVSSAVADPVAVRQRMAAAPEEILTTVTTTVTRALRRARPLAAATPADVEEDAEDYTDWVRAYRETTALRSWLVSVGLTPPTPSWRQYAAVVEMPTEVLLALAPPGFVLPFAPRLPRPLTGQAPEEQVGRSAAAAASDFLATAMTVLEGLARRPLSAVKAGGIGARELARHGKAVGAEVPDVRLALTLAGGAGLLGVTPDGRLTVADGFDDWRRQRPAERAVDLITAWLTEELPATLDRDADGKAVPALGGDERYSTLHLGLELTGLVAQLPGQAVIDVTQLMEVVAWYRPLAHTPAGAAECWWAEAHRLGLLADGAITSLGQAFITADRDRAVAALDAMLPEVSGHALIGSDQTVLVPGSPDPAVVDLLDIVATREARGVANTWRITPESVRSALDDGYVVEDLIAALEKVSRKELPQALRYVMQDVARRHGHLRVRSGACVVLSEDQALLAEVAATRGLRTLELELVAPTVALSSQPAETVLTSLRSAGYLPVMSDGAAPAVRLRRPPGLTGTAAGGGGEEPGSPE